MKIESRKVIYDSLEKYDMLSDPSDYIEITEWTNGDGYDITIVNKSRMQSFNLTHGEIDAINYLTKHLELNKD